MLHHRIVTISSRRYAVALLLVGLLAVMERLFPAAFGARLCCLAIFVAVIVATLYGGLGPGLLTLGLSTGHLAWLAPQFLSGASLQPGDAFLMTLLSLTAIAMSARPAANPEAPEEVNTKSEAHQRAEEALHKSQHRYRELAEAIPAMLCAIDAEGMVFDHNRRWSEFTGQSAGSNQRQRWVTVVYPPDVPRLAALWKEVSLTGQLFEIECRLRRACDGTYRWHFVQAMTQRDGAGEITGWSGACIDIEDKKQAQENLRIATERFQAALGNSAISVFNQDQELRYTWIYNPSVHFVQARVLGQTDRELLEQSEEAEALEVFKREVLTSGRGRRREVCLHHQGEARHYDLNVEPQRNGEGEIVGITGVCVDVTKRRNLEDQLRLSEQRLRDGLNAGRVFTFEWDCVTNLVFRSDSSNAILGLPAGSERDTFDGFFEKICVEDRAPFLFQMRGLTPDQPWYRSEYRVTRGDNGQVVWIEEVGSVEFDAQGHILQVRGVSRDITERKQAKETVDRLNENLEARVRERTSELWEVLISLEQEMSARRRLEMEILEISEREQCRLGQDLHDDLGQQLFAIGLFAHLLTRELTAEGHPRAAECAHLKAALESTVNTTRNLAKSFYPVELDRDGFPAALEDLALRTEQLTKVHCETRIDAGFEIGREGAIHLYRIVQEAIANAIKHGKAKNIVTHCQLIDGRRIVTVTNDGADFQAPAPGEPSGIGLHVFQYRARILGATLEVGAVEGGSGSRVICRFHDSLTHPVRPISPVSPVSQISPASQVPSVPSVPPVPRVPPVPPRPPAAPKSASQASHTASTTPPY